jgi:hypothetical protein
MERKDAFKERERGLETEYFHKQDVALLEKLRRRARLDEVAQALAEKLNVDDPALLRRVVDLGITKETGPALLLAPLVHVAWAEGSVSRAERATILAIAAAGGVDPGSPAHGALSGWLDERPSQELFDAAMAVIEVGLSVLPAPEREERVRRIIDLCTRVARASGGLAWLPGVGGDVSSHEAALLDAMNARLRAAGAPKDRD